LNHTPQFSTLRFRVLDGIAEIRFTRPDLANRFDEPGHREFADALDLASRTPEVRVLILCADGKVFSAGGDFDEISEAGKSAQVRDRMVRDALRVFHTLVACRFPVIAAVQGAAAGLGATIMTLCDIIVASRNAKISDPHVAVGIVAGDGGIIGWTQSIGIIRAKRFLLTGDSLTAPEAHAMGLVTDLVDAPEQVVPRAEEIARRIIALPRGGVEVTKRAFARLTQQTALSVLELGLAYEMESMMSPEVDATLAQIKARLRK
jgi:enoyl-CoA hydratase